MGRLRAALALASRWPVVLVKPGSKEPLTRHGVKDATTDPSEIRRLFERWPDANVAVACGAPGPTVLDVDDLRAIGNSNELIAQIASAPSVATTRGRHWWFAGQNRATVALGYGELRGLGSYVLCPPSIHPSGREYVWLLAPSGPLPPVPALLTRTGMRRGHGEIEAPVEPVPYGQRHGHLTDFAVRLLRGGITDRRRIEAHLRLEFELSCEALPPPDEGYFDRIASWATRSQIAERERWRNGR